MSERSADDQAASQDAAGVVRAQALADILSDVRTSGVAWKELNADRALELIFDLHDRRDGYAKRLRRMSHPETIKEVQRRIVTLDAALTVLLERFGDATGERLTCDEVFELTEDQRGAIQAWCGSSDEDKAQVLTVFAHAVSGQQACGSGNAETYLFAAGAALLALRALSLSPLGE